MNLKQITRRNNTYLVPFLIFISTALLITIWNMFGYINMSFAKTGKTWAKIIAVENPHPKGIWRIATYQYQIGGISYVKTENLTVQVIAKPMLVPGDRLILQYDPKNPETASAIHLNAYLLWIIILVLMDLTLLWLFCNPSKGSSQ